jgi:predicted site-specific integrase-resolvase
MSYTLGQAAQATGKSKMTIQRVIKKGLISANKNDSGEWEIDPSELHRVFPTITESDVSKRIVLRKDTTNDIRILQQEIEMRDEKIRLIGQQNEREYRQLQDTINDLRLRLDQSEEERRKTQTQLTALLTDQRQKEPQGLLQRLFRG